MITVDGLPKRKYTLLVNELLHQKNEADAQTGFARYMVTLSAPLRHTLEHISHETETAPDATVRRLIAAALRNPDRLVDAATKQPGKINGKRTIIHINKTQKLKLEKIAEKANTTVQKLVLAAVSDTEALTNP